MELILTEEEKAAATWLELDDAAVGRMVKYNCGLIAQFCDEHERIRNMAAGLMLVTATAECNAEELTQTLHGCSSGDKEIGDWEITIRKLSPNT